MVTNTSGWKYDIPSAPIEDSLSLAQKLDAGELREQVVRSSLPFARILPDPMGMPKPTGSYLGGYPFMPVGESVGYPVDADGTPLYFLGQINFAELPEGIPGLPTEGLLQWFVESGENYGLSFESDATGREGLVVRWFSAEQLAAGSASSPFDIVGFDYDLHDDWHTYTPFINPDLIMAVTFRKEVGISGVNSDDFVFKGNVVEAGGKQVYLRDFLDSVGLDLSFGKGDKIGGYPAPTQGDPREGRNEQARQLLIQLDSESDAFVLWGDMGTAQLFGDPQALAKGDTSSLWWDWACH